MEKLTDIEMESVPTCSPCGKDVWMLPSCLKIKGDFKMKSDKLNKRTLDPLARQAILNSLASLYENLRKNPTDSKTRENVQMHSDTEEYPAQNCCRSRKK